MPKNILILSTSLRKDSPQPHHPVVAGLRAVRFLRLCRLIVGVGGAAYAARAILIGMRRLCRRRAPLDNRAAIRTHPIARVAFRRAGGVLGVLQLGFAGPAVQT